MPYSVSFAPLATGTNYLSAVIDGVQFGPYVTAGAPVHAINGRVFCNATATSFLWLASAASSPASGNYDVTATMRCVTAMAYGGMTLKYLSTTSRIWWWWVGGNLVLLKRNGGGSDITVATAALPLTQGSDYEFTCRVRDSGAGTSVAILCNGTQIVEPTVISDVPSGAGQTGLFLRDGSSTTGLHWASLGTADVAVAPTVGTVSNQSVTAPNAATFSASVSGATSLQWERSADGTTWADISGATTASYTTGATTVSGGTDNNSTQYRLKATNSAGTTTSNAATLTVQAAASGTVTLTDLTNGRVFQRAAGGTSASIAISGTYTGSPGAVQAQVTRVSDSSVAVAWTTITTSFSGGTFSGSLTVPVGGPYTVAVRTQDQSSTSTGTNQWYVGALYLWCGQSNTVRPFTDGSGTADALVRVHTASGWAALGTTGAGATALGAALRSGLNMPIGLLRYGIGSTGLVAESATSGYNGYWLNTASGQPYALAKTGVLAAGGAIEGIIWAQGEQDAIAAGAVTQSMYETGFGTLLSRFRADFTNASTLPNLPIYTSVLGTTDDSRMTDEHWDGIRRAILRCATLYPNVYIGVSSVDLPRVDSWHYTPAGYVTQAQRFARSILAVLGVSGYTYYRGPQVASITPVSSTVYDVTLTNPSGADITPSTGITGWRALDGTTVVTISSVARQSANVLRVTLASAPAGALTLQYQYGKAPAVSGAVYDTSAAALPLEATAPLSAGAVAQPVQFTSSIPGQSGTVGMAAAALSLTAYFTGNQTPFVFAVTGGALPPGLSLSGSSIAGTPTTAGSYSATIRVTDAANNQATATVNWNIAAAAVTATTASVTLTSDGTTPAANLSGLSYYAVAGAPGSLGAVIAQSANGGATNGSGVLSVNIAAAGLAPGAAVELVVRHPGTKMGWNGPAVVA